MSTSSNPKVARLFDGDPPMLRVGLCQVYTEDWAIEANAQRTMDALQQAADGGAELAITPECVLHGYCYADRNKADFRQRIGEIAEELDGPRIGAFRDKARELKMDIIICFAERGKGGAIHNSAATISRDGEIVSVYRKVHCRDFESAVHGNLFTPGEEFLVVERPYAHGNFRIGTMICFDREVPEATRCLRALGAEFIACPLATSTKDLGKYIDYADNEMITRCRAAENEVFIAVVNHAGRDFFGGSFIVGPGGERLCQMGCDAGVEVLDVPVGILAREYHSKPLGWMGWGNRRPEVYREYLG